MSAEDANDSGASELGGLQPPTEAQQDAVRQIVLSAFGDSIARCANACWEGKWRAGSDNILSLSDWWVAQYPESDLRVTSAMP